MTSLVHPLQRAWRMKDDVGVLERLIGRPVLAVDAGTVLTRRGEIGDHMAVIVDGRVAVQVGGKDICFLGPGETVGEAAVVGEPTREVTAKAVTPARLLVVSIEAFERLRNEGEGFASELELLALGTQSRVLAAIDGHLLRHPRDYAPDWHPERATLMQRIVRWLGVSWAPARPVPAVEALRGSGLIGDLLPDDLPVLSKVLRGREVSPGHVFFVQGDTPADLHLLVEGRVEATLAHDGQIERLGTIEAGEVFGITSLLEDRPHYATCVATERSVVLKLDVEAFEQLAIARSQAGDALRSAVIRSLARTVARASTLLGDRLLEDRETLDASLADLRDDTPIDRAREGFR